MRSNIGKGIIFLIGQDHSSYNYRDLKYASSNENLQETYFTIGGIQGIGLFVIGGFDQVASLLSHSDLTLAHLVDVNLTAVEYARLRLALTQICDTRFEYIGRLISRKVTKEFKDILSFYEYIRSKESAKRMLSVIDYFCNNEYAKRLLPSSMHTGTIEAKLDSLKKFNLLFEETVNMRGREWQKDEFRRDLHLYEQHLNEKEKCFDLEFAQETAALLRDNFGISQQLLDETILNHSFERCLNQGKENDRIADRRLWSFIESNLDNWLSTDLYFEKVKSMYHHGKIKFSHLDLANSPVSLNLFGDLSLIYLSNVHEWLNVELDQLIVSLDSNGLKYDDKTVFISTSTKEEGRGKIITRNL